MASNEYKRYIYEGVQENIDEIDDIINNIDLTGKCSFNEFCESQKIDLQKCSEEKKKSHQEKYIDEYYPYLIYTHPYIIEEIKINKAYVVEPLYDDGLPSENI
jgi:hypothetical protein